MEPECDLWGDPLPAPVEKRGRPAHAVTESKRLRVAVLRSLNKTAGEIALAMDISERTLRAYYKKELRVGLHQKRAEVMVRLWEQVEKGNVSAMREFLRQTKDSDLGPAIAAQPKAERKLGKKEQAMKDALAPDQADTLGELMIRRSDDLRQVH